MDTKDYVLLDRHSYNTILQEASSGIMGSYSEAKSALRTVLFILSREAQTPAPETLPEEDPPEDSSQS
jgi:hypothetical protein